MPEFPRELIRQVQISTRSAAGLSRYDPSNFTLPSPPSISDAIADLEPSSPQLRCNHCKGRLLRGLQSNICVYCGARCRHDVTPDPEPIFFNSTIGYQWLIRSLNLDGSEIVKPLTNKNDQDQGQSSQKSEMPLSEFLNFRIACLSEKYKQDRVASSQHSEENKGFSLLDRVAPDNFFFRSNGDGNQVQTASIKEVTALEDQNLFQGVQPPVPDASGNIDKSIDAFSGWEADFQSSVSENPHVISKLSDDFVGVPDVSQESIGDSQSSHFTSTEVDLSAHIESVFGNKNDLILGMPTDHSIASPASDWTSDDVWTHTSFNESQLVGGFDAAFDSVKDLPTEKSNISADFFQDFQSQSDNTDMLENKTVNGGKYESQDIRRFDKNANTKDDNAVEISTEAPSVDLFKDFQSQTNGADIVDNRRVNEEQGTINQSHPVDVFFATSNTDGLSAEGDFTEGDLFQDFERQTNQLDTTDNKNINNLQAAVNDESFDEWNDFTGSTSTRDPSKDAGIQNDDIFISQKESPDVDLFSPSTKFEDRNLGSSSEPTLSPTLVAIKDSTSGISDIFSNNPSNRLIDASGTSKSVEDDVKMLISQMVDLSFMLKSDLCIPSAADSRKPSTRDR